MIEILTELDALWAAFEEKPDDPVNGPALADRLSEEGLHAESLAVRWMHAEGKAPCWDCGTATWDWWRRGEYWDVRDRNILPEKLFDALPAGLARERFPGLQYDEYPAFADACRALGVALAACPEEVDRCHSRS